METVGVGNDGKSVEFIVTEFVELFAIFFPFTAIVNRLKHSANMVFVQRSYLNNEKANMPGKWPCASTWTEQILVKTLISKCFLFTCTDNIWYTFKPKLQFRSWMRPAMI